LLQTKLEFRQTQSLVITPQLQQAIKLLQLSNLDLTNFLEREIEQNPLIDWEDNTANKSAELSQASNNTEPEPGATPDEANSSTGFEEPGEAYTADAGASDDQEHFQGAAEFKTLSVRSAGHKQSDSPQASVLDFTPEQTTLRDHLRQQLHITISDPTRQLIGDYLIDLIDDAGYLREPVEQIAERLNSPAGLIVDVLSIIQTFEPVGVGARSLAECLSLQLRDLDRFDPAMEKLIDHLDLLAKHDLAALRRLCGVDQEDLSDMIAEIRALNPRPGHEIGFAAVESVTPDILVDRDPSGGWTVQLNGDTLPRICINQSFYSSAKRSVRTEKDKAYLRGCMATANWLVRSLHQRRRTMLKVSREIVRQQEMFFEHGVRGLRPLSLKDVAERIGMHESTVSRVTSSKYMQTPRGTFELKYFFTSAIQSSSFGDAHSSEAVKYRIKELIDNEAQSQVLSDDKIVRMLRGEGVNIARRTVAKYRETMRIPSSTQRRRIKNMLAQH
jgi:RNA polymerase sigma-54 factor